ncbi:MULTISPECIES: LacI family DNA-binding transcriptional regulator [Mammaliicoccus]|uniref:LacI family DNA-binding transcriptional regulator n=1 Tax=Mammaliicoccus TaxID=2803850 RepID=UPI001EFBCD86|nr:MULTISPECIES: LacI family DNA-binding transcriptional regulator [unclassified Mammaliicoccus]
MDKKNLSIKEIAEISGVSVATVSRVINQNGRFSKETEKKVLEVIKNNNYKTNLVAKSLRMKQTNTIGVIVPDIKNEFFASIVSEIEEYFFEEENYTVFICNSNGEKEKELDYLASLDSKGVDGLIYISGYDDTLHTSVRRNIPVVCIDRKPKENNEVAIIESDNLDGGYQATSLLIEKGCKNIVILKSEKDTSTNLDRFEGYRKAIEESSNHLNEELIISLKKTHFNYAKDAINKLIEKNIKFDGIFAINDWLALGALYALKDNNFKIPDEVKIVGFDNVSISKYSYPNITTVNQNKKLMGRTAAKTLLDLINNKQTKNKIHTKLPIDIVYRGTT